MNFRYKLCIWWYELVAARVAIPDDILPLSIEPKLFYSDNLKYLTSRKSTVMPTSYLIPHTHVCQHSLATVLKQVSIESQFPKLTLHFKYSHIVFAINDCFTNKCLAGCNCHLTRFSYLGSLSAGETWFVMLTFRNCVQQPVRFGTCHVVRT